MLERNARAKDFDWVVWGAGAVAAVVVFAAVAALALAVLALRAWVLTELWSLYLVPLFEMRELPFAGALGVCLIASFPTLRCDIVVDDDDDDGKRRWARLAGVCLVPLFALFLGHAYLWVWPL